MDWRNKLDMIQNKIRAQLFARKIDDLEGVYRLMGEVDQDNSGYLDKDEFQKFLSRIGVFLTVQELRSVYDKYDANKDGNIAYAEFVSLIRDSMSEKRQNTVRNAFRFLDCRNQGRIHLDQLYNQYQATSHPRVRTRQKTADQVMNEFANAISKRSRDGQTIDEQEFLNYYADVNATLPSEKEEYFADLVTSTWGVTSGADYVSPARLAQLETILFEKIRQKTVAKDDEGKTVKKAFQYFDLEDKGTISMGQFAQALAKFGCVFTDKEITALFNKYDGDKSGRLCYDEFCGLIALMGSGNNPNVNPVFQLSRQPPVQTLNRIKSDLIKKGQHMVRKLSLIFYNSDKNKNGTLNRQEFQWAMKEAGFSLTKTEYDNLFKYFDKNCDDEISFFEFIGFVKIPLSEQRLQITQQAWMYLNPDNDQAIAASTLRNRYDASKSWDVMASRRTVADASKDFLQSWEGYVEVTYDEFVNYYTEVSALVDDDKLFDTIVRNAWK